jgi:hypothetical protein
MNKDPYKSHIYNEVFRATSILKKPVTGIVSGYHELPYILIAPDEENPDKSLEINGKINVSPKIVISPEYLGETFGDVFDPETFSQEIQGRLFSFAYSSKRNLKVESEQFSITNHESKAEERLNEIQDILQMQENIRTGLIFGPRFKYYPVSLDKFIGEIIDREFRV